MNEKRHVLEVMLRVIRIKLQQYELEHAEAVRDRAAERARLEALLEDLERTRSLVAASRHRGPLEGGELADIHDRLSALARSIKAQAEAVEECEKRVEEAKRLLVDAHRKVKSLETLEARLKEAAYREQARNDERHVEFVFLSKQLREGV